MKCVVLDLVSYPIQAAPAQHGQLADPLSITVSAALAFSAAVRRLAVKLPVSASGESGAFTLAFC